MEIGHVEAIEPDPLEELHAWLQQQQVNASHAAGLENAGRSSAYARVMQRIRDMQNGRVR